MTELNIQIVNNQISFTNGNSARTKGTWSINARVAKGEFLKTKIYSGTYTGNPWADGDVVLSIDGTTWQTITISNTGTTKGDDGYFPATFTMNVYEVNNSIGAVTEK